MIELTIAEKKYVIKLAKNIRSTLIDLTEKKDGFKSVEDVTLTKAILSRFGLQSQELYYYLFDLLQQREKMFDKREE